MAGKGALGGLPAALDASFVGVLSNTFEASQGGSQDDDSMLEAEQPLHGGSRKRGRGAAASTGGGQADYAMRHQAAEQRRRARINERLDALRKLVPHDPRSNTASFLEDVIKYILAMKDTNEKLEQALLASHQGAHNMVAAANVAASSRNPKPQAPAAATTAAASSSQPVMPGPRPNGGASPPAATAVVPSVTSPAAVSPLQASLVQAQVQSLQQLLTLQGGLPPAGMQAGREADATSMQQALLALQHGATNQDLLRNLLASGQLATLSSALPTSPPLVLPDSSAVPSQGGNAAPALKAER